MSLTPNYRWRTKVRVFVAGVFFFAGMFAWAWVAMVVAK